MIQNILVYIAVALALFFLIRKFLFKPKKKSGCGTDCGC
ncbi:FeoB-associated Cys-rich membrane protein [Aureibaculum marinum]|uniref:FeoB-associated Cys-rich membrane protein n=2 Tax=Pseudomonadati TaxID=3379134 RepID=A0A3N4NV11_9FLAO|nr:FeoB-associated Cys-rich membrane protein [Aureibaculum marinum]RPE00192.1 FeoB-associated Cys-rich membrane protein [Aureibaculum marinum]TDA86108.1 FeoB-associated Cys-rich membrane protein [Halomonas marinisediminis]